MSIRAILIDLDDTIVVEAASAEAAFLATAEVACQQCAIDPVILAQSARRHAGELWRAAPTIAYCRAIGLSSWEGLWTDFLGDDPNLAILREWSATYRRETWIRAFAEHGVEQTAFAEELGAALFEQRHRR